MWCRSREDMKRCASRCARLVPPTPRHRRQVRAISACASCSSTDRKNSCTKRWDTSFVRFSGFELMLNSLRFFKLEQLVLSMRVLPCSAWSFLCESCFSLARVASSDCAEADGSEHAPRNVTGLRNVMLRHVVFVFYVYRKRRSCRKFLRRFVNDSV